MSGGGLGSVLGLGASLIAPEFAPEIFGSGASLGTRLLSNAVLGGGIAALTGGNPFLGALAGGAGAGIKGLMSGPEAQFMGNTGAPAAEGANIAGPGANVLGSQAAADALANQAATGQFANQLGNFSGVPLDPSATLTGTPSAIPNVQGVGNIGYNAAQITGDAGLAGLPSQNPISSIGQPAVTSPATQVSNQLNAETFKNIPAADYSVKAQIPYSSFDGKIVGPDGHTLYSGVDVGKVVSPVQKSFIEQYKYPLMAGGAGLLLAASKQKPIDSLTTVQAPKFGLAANYQRTGNPNPVYVRKGGEIKMAEGGIAALADGGTSRSQPVNVDFMHGDMFPMSQQERSFYATPTQMPTSAQQTLASYEPKTNPLTGQATAHMAEGGDVKPLSQFAYDITPTDRSSLLSQTSYNPVLNSIFKALTTKNMADGGIADIAMEAKGGMLKGPGDGMSDSIPGTIGGVRPARLADGEFVVPADVVSHLGNGSTDAGAKHLYSMMDRIRKARTGRKSQGKQINPARYMPA